MIEELIVSDNGLPSKHNFLDLYILTNNNEILKTSIPKDDGGKTIRSI